MERIVHQMAKQALTMKIRWSVEIYDRLVHITDYQHPIKVYVP